MPLFASRKLGGHAGAIGGAFSIGFLRFGSLVQALVRVLGEFNAQIAAVEAELAEALKITRTPRSCAVRPDLVWSSVPGSWRSSVTIGPAMRMPERDAAMPAALRSPVRQALGWWSWPGWRATAVSPMRSTCGPSAR